MEQKYEYTETFDKMMKLLKKITHEDKWLVIAVCNPLKTEKMQLEMYNWLLENKDNKKLMDESHLIEKTLQIIGVIE